MSVKKKLKISTNNISDINEIKKLKKREEELNEKTSHLTLQIGFNEFIKDVGEENIIESGIVILRTKDNDFRSSVIGMNNDKVISTVEEFKQRFYFSKFFGEDKNE